MNMTNLMIMSFIFSFLLLGNEKTINPIITNPETTKLKVLYTEKLIWNTGESLLEFFAKNNIPNKLYYNLSVIDKELTAEIYAGSTYYVTKNHENKVVRVFIPISESGQIRLNFVNGEYKLDIVSIASIKVNQKIILNIQNNLYDDLLNYSNDKSLAGEFVSIYKGVINFKKLIQPNDKLGVIYDRNYRMGKKIGIPEIMVTMLEVNKKSNYMFGYKDKYYDIEGREIGGFLFILPLKKYSRISSPFSLGRKHPILGIIRPHYGVDYAASIGTPIYSSSDGKVIFAGKKGGYGNVVEISHQGGIKTLYAHMHKIGKNIKVGKEVKRGATIGTVGSTGLSTGPHLHFGVYKNNTPINPKNFIRSAGDKLKKDERNEFNAMALKFKDELNNYIVSNKDSVSAMKKTIINVD